MRTDSSVLVSSSKYLDSAILRDWIATHYLRRSGLDYIDFSDNYVLNSELARLRDDAEVDALIARQRGIDPAFDRWMAERHLSRIDVSQLGTCAPGSVGARYLEHIRAMGIEVDVGFRFAVRSDYDYLVMRQSEIHDFEHIVCGGQFNMPGEMPPVWATIVNAFVHLAPELAGALNLRNILGTQRWVVRSVLHYPHCVASVLEGIDHGIRVGLASDPLYLARYEQVLHMTPARARTHLGVREAVEMDSHAAGLRYGEPDPDGVRDRIWAEDTAAGIPYIKRGRRPLTTDSSRRVSSSKYLNDPRLRDWVSTHFLRRNGPDLPPAADLVELDEALGPLRDGECVQALLEREAHSNPAVARWIHECMTWPAAPSGAAGPHPESLGTLAAAHCRAKAENPRGADAPLALFENQRARAARFEACERLLVGAGFDTLGEVRLHWARLSNAFRHLSPELAGALCVPTVLAAYRLVHRAMLHYPRAWLTIVQAIRDGYRIGMASECLATLPCEAVLHLPLDEARTRLGIRAVGPPVETRSMSAIFDGSA
ncbi:MAG: Coq4 family protein [Gammaproteobacteria bacterium]